MDSQGDEPQYFEVTMVFRTAARDEDMAKARALAAEALVNEAYSFKTWDHHHGVVKLPPEYQPPVGITGADNPNDIGHRMMDERVRRADARLRELERGDHRD